VNSNYAFADADATNLYNHPEYWKPKQAAEDIVKAERSIVWLNPDHIVIYDRVDAKIAGLFRNFNLSLLTAPQIQGTTMQETVGDQQLTLQSLLPATASLAEQHFWKKNPAKEYHLVAALEPSTDRLVITDTASPASTRFLNVLQGTDAGTPADLATHIASSAGTAFDGAVVGNTDVMFTVQPGNFTSLTYSVNLAVTQHLITGLSPSTGYTVTTTPGDTSTTVVVTTGGTSVTDPAGVLAVGFPQSSLPTQAGIESSWLLNQPE
jgi:hypothetical protein